MHSPSSITTSTHEHTATVSVSQVEAEVTKNTTQRGNATLQSDNGFNCRLTVPNVFTTSSFIYNYSRYKI